MSDREDLPAGSAFLFLDVKQRRRATVREALLFFYDPHTFPPNDSETVDDFVTRTVHRSKEGKPSVSETLEDIHAAACIVATYMPDAVLETLRAEPPVFRDHPERWQEVRTTFIREMINASAIADIASSMMRDLVDRFGSRTPQEDNAVLPELIQRSAEQLSEDANLRRLRERLMYEDSRVSTKDIRHYRHTVSLVEGLIEQRETFYSRLTFSEVLFVRGKTGLCLSLLASAALVVAIIDSLTGGRFSVISMAHAQGAPATANNFVPPLGLPPGLWVWMIVGFYVVLLVILAACIWAAYLAPRKSEKAANIVDRFATLALGVLLGKVSVG